MDGFTAVRCAACAQMPSGFDEDAHGTVAALPGVDEVLVEGLRAVVQDSAHGMLVTSGCRFGPGVCAGRRPGMMVLVQACDAGRRHPESPVVAVGPVRSTDDVRAVTRWLQGGGAPDPQALPARLRCAIAPEAARG
ncbi:hypothetical protein FRP1_07525 [Pseudonocardia sp. EC080625-04]|uniref:hypothetical protein n=1 Tax=unclassified Pseudonocardia TaxID=2619320 RepID=UPI0006CB756F|nr:MULTISPECIES: hypothetical protein [unclassified Pseudonocardia]ALE72983.1 hypothetical protein FRP1_07525 [Pseudonocardia sp. EC080625-04]